MEKLKKLFLSFPNLTLHQLFSVIIPLALINFLFDYLLLVPEEKLPKVIEDEEDCSKYSFEEDQINHGFISNKNI